MQSFSDALEALKDSNVPRLTASIVGGISLLGGSLLLVDSCLGDPPTTTKDGITFEHNGTAIAGRESGDGWLDLKCNNAGKVTVKVVKRDGWVIIEEGSFQHPACKDGHLTVDDAIDMEDIPEELRD